MIDRDALRAGLDAAGADGWLLFDFHGLNPVAGRVLGLTGMGTRRLFALFPRDGEPVAVAHRIELHRFAGFEGTVLPYARWEELREALAPLVAGRTLAMEVSPEDAVPYLDRVPHGVVELLTALGARIVPSGSLVTTFSARWTAAETEGHLVAAEALATIAREALGRAVREGGKGLTETALQAEVIAAIHARGLVFDHPPIVAFGANAANPHYEPGREGDPPLEPQQVILLDLWAGPALGTVFADQTWMGFSGEHPPERVLRVWEVVRSAREAACRMIRDRVAAGREVRGFEGDRAARAVIEAAGFGANFVHRTGHSIDRDLHGSGPHLDDYETHDDRLLVPGVGFSVEPGIYLPGEFGVRSEVNMYWGAAGPTVTPAEPQAELITPLSKASGPH
ncbi:MAG TPA: M24 family metallopeptidase [Gemmatimonadales bacterium]|nr:M24 family metallopeptidase [Gemmatimonadales bacterium]